MPIACPDCRSVNNDVTESQTICADCGCVLEDSQIVSDVTFAENSAGGAVVQGSYVGNDQRGARTTGPGGFRSGGEGASREQTLQNAQRAIKALGTSKNVPSVTIEKASRLFKLALEGGSYQPDATEPKNFVLGRKSEYTQASCLYVACRMDQTNMMLIDFADAIGVNVFVLGRSYLRLIRCLGYTMPVVDPSIYISRFASMLDFGDETQRIATDATRLVKRFKQDWITHGRRPAGVCGACLLLAARMNNFRRSIAEIIQVVKIADVTLRKRLEEFRQTPSAKLTVDDFRSIWLEEEYEPPSFYLARQPKKPKRELKADRLAKKRKLNGEYHEEEGVDGDDEDEQSGDEADGEEEGNGKGKAVDNLVLDPQLEAMADKATHEEIAQYLQEDVAQDALAPPQPGQASTSQQDTAKRSDTAPPEDDLTNLDDEELDGFILSPAEVHIKTRVWMEFNRDYLERMLERQLKMEADVKAGIQVKPARRKRNKPRESSAAPSTAAESTKQMMKKRKFSKRLNYDVIATLFDDAKASVSKHKRSRSDVASDDDEDDDDDEAAVERAARGATSDIDTVDGDVIEEEGGSALPSNHPLVRKRSKADMKMREKRRQQSIATTDGEGDDGASRGGAGGVTTDADSDSDAGDKDESWRLGLSFGRANNADDDYGDDPYGEEA